MSKNVKVVQPVRYSVGGSMRSKYAHKVNQQMGWIKQAEQVVSQAVADGFDFNFKNKDDVFDCRAILSVASWMVEPRLKGEEGGYDSVMYTANCRCACSLFEGFEFRIKNSTDTGADMYADFIRKVGEFFDLNGKANLWADAYALMATRYELPLYVKDNLDCILSALMQMITSIHKKTSFCDLRMLELFSQKTVTCVHKFVTACLDGEDAYEVQKYLNEGAFAIMTLPKGASRYLSKKGRHFVRFVAACLYMIYAQNESFQYSLSFKNIDFKELMPKVQVGRVEWTYGFYTGKFNSTDSRFMALYALVPEPGGITVKVKESKVREYARVSRLHHAVHNYYHRMCEFLLRNCLIDYTYFTWQENMRKLEDEAKEDVRKKTKELDEAAKQIKQLKNDNRASQRQVTSLETQVGKLTKQNEKLTAELSEVKASDIIKQKDELITSLNNKTLELEKTTQLLESKLSSAQTRIKSLESKKTKKASNDEELRALRDQVADLQEALDKCIVEEVGVSMEDIANFCRKVKPFVMGGVKGFERTLDKVFAEYSYFDVADADYSISLPDSSDCVIIYTRVIGHSQVEHIKAQLPQHIPLVYLDFSNADLIRKTVYNALKSRD